MDNVEEEEILPIPSNELLLSNVLPDSHIAGKINSDGILFCSREQCLEHYNSINIIIVNQSLDHVSLISEEVI